MCGLIGIAGNLTHSLENKVFRNMLDVCQVRGRDSTGVFKVRKDNSYTWVKNIGPPSNLVDHRIYEQTLAGPLAKIMAGHCRHATVGGVSVKNAHPFDVGEKFIGMHNGTLRSCHKLDTNESGMVDSEVLIRHIAKHGAKNTFSEVEGAWACVWWDEEEGTLNFIRNNERPLYLVRSKSGDVLAWASEPWMFGCLGREIPLDEIINLSEDTWLSYPFEAGKDEIGKARTAKIERRKVEVVDYTNVFPGPHSSIRRSQSRGSNVATLHIPHKSANDGKKLAEAIDPFTNKPLCTVRDVAGINFITNSHTGLEYSSARFFDSTGGKCCFCNYEIDSLNEVAEIFSEDYFICHHCFDDCYGEEMLKRAN